MSVTRPSLLFPPSPPRSSPFVFFFSSLSLHRASPIVFLALLCSPPLPSSSVCLFSMQLESRGIFIRGMEGEKTTSPPSKTFGLSSPSLFPFLSLVGLRGAGQLTRSLLDAFNNTVPQPRTSIENGIISERPLILPRLAGDG